VLEEFFFMFPVKFFPNIKCHQKEIN
jgi:hypothetical protein